MLRDALLAQRGGLIGWLPVCLSIGIGAYFALRFEPGPVIWWSVAALALVMLIAARVVAVALRPVCLGLALICAGAGLAKLETLRMTAPVLGFRYYGPVEGRVVNIDRSSSDAVRLTLDRVRLDRMDPARTHARPGSRVASWGPAIAGLEAGRGPDPHRPSVAPRRSSRAGRL
ncbi:MAG: competence protein ComEC [Loktanella salsilacus]|jgi:competence protein ComEC